MDLSEVKKWLKDNHIRGLALDIDETLCASDDHWWNRMYELHPPKDLRREEIAANYRFAEDVPAWQTEEAQASIKGILNSSEFHEAIPLIEGADKAVEEINKVLPIVAYITARPPTVFEATKNWLRKHRFPEAELIMRPEEITLHKLNNAKNKWKAQVLLDLYPEVMGIVDDNSTLVTELRKIGYEGKIFLYGDYPTDLDTAGENVILCPSWRDVLKAVSKDHL